MPAPQTENVADDAHHLSRREVRGGHVFIGMGTREKRLQGFSGRARPVGYVVEAWRIVGKKRPKFLIRSDDMTNVALAERETVAFLHCASMGRLLRARGGGHRAGKHRQKGCPRPAAHAGILQRCSRSALIYINRRAGVAQGRGFESAGKCPGIPPGARGRSAHPPLRGGSRRPPCAGLRVDRPYGK